MAEDENKGKKIRVHFSERMTRSIGKTQDFYDGAPGRAIGLSPPWNLDGTRPKPAITPEQKLMESWATDRGKDFAHVATLPPIPPLHRPKPKAGTVPRPWKTAECHDQFLDSQNFVQSRVVTNLDATRLEGALDSIDESGPGGDGVIRTLGDLMEVIAWETAMELKTTMEEAGAATYGFVGVVFPNLDAFGPKVWCERQKVIYEIRILQKILTEAQQDVLIAKWEADRAYMEFSPEEVPKLMGCCCEYGRIQECMTPFRQMSSTTYRKAKFLAKQIHSAMKLLQSPIEYALLRLHERRSAPSPAADLTGDLGVFMVRQAISLYGRHYARCFDFGSKVAAQATVRKKEAEWAIHALNEFLDMRAEGFAPTFDLRNSIAVGTVGGKEAVLDAPTPPSKPFVSSDAWMAARDSFLKMREAQTIREVMRAQNFKEADVESLFPAFPDDHEGDIRSFGVDLAYYDKQMKKWAPRTAIATAMKNRAEGKSNLRGRDSFALPSEE